MRAGIKHCLELKWLISPEDVTTPPVKNNDNTDGDDDESLRSSLRVGTRKEMERKASSSFFQFPDWKQQPSCSQATFCLS